jgi:hypothetical protein
MDQSVTQQNEDQGQIQAIQDVLGGNHDKVAVVDEDSPVFTFYRIMVEQLGWKGSDQIYSHEPTERKALQRVATELALALHASIRETDATDLVSTDFNHLVRAIRRLKALHGLTELGVMILLDKLVSDGLYKNLYYCTSPTAFFRRSPELFGIEPSRARDLQQRGKNYRIHWNRIDKGVGSVPPMALDELCLKHLSKLTLLDQAVSAFGAEEAMRLFHTSTYRQFASAIREKLGNPAKSPKAASPEQAETVTTSITQTIKEPKHPLEVACARILKKRGTVYLATGASVDQVSRALERLEEYRASKDEEKKVELGAKPYDYRNPLKVDPDLWSITNAIVIKERIKLGIAQGAARRRTIALLMHRLATETPFSAYWRNPRFGVRYTNFGAFAKGELFMGEEYRDYLRVGRNLAQYHYVLDGMKNIDEDRMFYKLRYLDDAIATYEGKVGLIRTRLASLSVREFQRFATDPTFETTFEAKFNGKASENLLGYVSRIHASLDNGEPVEVIELYGDDEIGRFNGILRAIKAEDLSTTFPEHAETTDIADESDREQGVA